jgi:aspartyl-tRNA(Asn)/glutamyl-tRNA(Gln) amidotransferase subunit B
MPELPETLFEKYTQTLGLPPQDAAVLTEEKEMSDYFNELVRETPYVKAAANWLLGPVKSWLNGQNAAINAFPLSPEKLASVIEIVQGGAVSFSAASGTLLPALLEQPSTNVKTLAASLNIVMDSNEDELLAWVNDVIASMPDKVKEYQKGKKGLIGLFVGEVKKKSRGKADPKKTTALLEEKLKG